jgi:hypothetical protein
MKTFKNIIVSIILVLTISLYWGQDVVDFLKHIHTIENTSNCADIKGLVSSDSSVEEDMPIAFPKNSITISNLGCEQLSSTVCFYPSNGFYSIWLPPDIS